MRAWILASLLVPSIASAEEPTVPDWKAFAEARNGECVGGKGKLAAPIAINVGAHEYQLHGHRLVQVDNDKDDVLRIGVISATKDEREETLDAIKKILGQLEKKKIEILIVNGDVGSTDFNMEEALMPAIAAAGVLVVVHTGNTESCGQFNKAAQAVFADHKNFINGNWVRQIELDDAVLFTLPGYHDRRFVHTGSAAKYDQADIDVLEQMMGEVTATKLLVAHGPPKQSGDKAIDLATGAGNVGDPMMTELLKRTNTSFGIFGHILEAGGRGTDLSGKEAKAQKKLWPALYVNAGTVNPDPWPMLDGKTSHGMGLYFEIKGKQAMYEVLKPQLR
jgi:Icc-related predicted phosphoesterase